MGTKSSIEPVTGESLGFTNDVGWVPGCLSTVVIFELFESSAFGLESEILRVFITSLTCLSLDN
jgi:hypothetical protein